MIGQSPIIFYLIFSTGKDTEIMISNKNVVFVRREIIVALYATMTGFVIFITKT